MRKEESLEQIYVREVFGKSVDSKEWSVHEIIFFVDLLNEREREREMATARLRIRMSVLENEDQKITKINKKCWRNSNKKKEIVS